MLFAVVFIEGDDFSILILRIKTGDGGEGYVNLRAGISFFILAHPWTSGCSEGRGYVNLIALDGGPHCLFPILTCGWPLLMEFGPGVSAVLNDNRDDAASIDIGQVEWGTGGDTKSKSSSSDINVTRLPRTLSEEGKSNSFSTNSELFMAAISSN